MTPIFPIRWRCPVARGATPADPADSKAQETVAAQHATFDAGAAERAEMMRELDALESLTMQQLKNEDEIMKKWIAMI